MKTALVIGASRGIGRQICLTLAKNGYNIGVASKTVQESVKLPGSIHSVAKEVENAGVRSLPLTCNVRQDIDIKNAVEKCMEHFGHIDLLVYNAGAISWQKVVDTPMKKFDLMQDVNPRGAYCTIQAVLPSMLKRGRGHIILVAPPIYSRFFQGKTPYAMGKVGMTVLVHGLANELTETGVGICALWPATAIESHVTQVLDVPPSEMTKSDIFADACLRIDQASPESINGRALIDEDYLRSLGVTDFTHYRCDPDREPTRMMPRLFPDLSVQEQNIATKDFNKKAKL